MSTRFSIFLAIVGSFAVIFITSNWDAFVAGPPEYVPPPKEIVYGTPFGSTRYDDVLYSDCEGNVVKRTLHIALNTTFIPSSKKEDL